MDRNTITRAITRDGRRVGYLEYLETSQREVIKAETVLPGLEGDQNGFAIVTEIGNSPVAALVFPYDGEAIEIDQVTQWVSGTEKPSGEESRLPDESAILQLAGEISVSGTGDRFSVDFRTESQPRQDVRSDFRFRLEIDDEDNRGYIRCDFRGDGGFGKGRFRGRFRGRLETESREGSADADFRFDFDFFGPGRGFGEGELFGRLRSSVDEETSAADFRFDFDFFVPGYGFGEGRFRGEAAGVPLFWLIQQTVNRARSDKRLPFRIWIGTVRYAREPAEALLARQQVANLLSRSAPPTTRDLNQILQWLATVIPRTRDSIYFRESPTFLLERIQVPEKKTRISHKEFGITFDESVPPEKALEFLVALGKELANAGGRLCFTQSKEDE